MPAKLPLKKKNSMFLPFFKLRIHSLSVVRDKLGNNIMKSNFLEWHFDFMKISQNKKYVFLLRSTFVINHFVKKTICKKIIFFLHIFVKDFLLTKCKRDRGPSARKSAKNHNLKARMEYSSKSSMAKFDHSKKTCF